jgi:hypothetical protein
MPQDYQLGKLALCNKAQRQAKSMDAISDF